MDPVIQLLAKILIYLGIFRNLITFVRMSQVFYRKNDTHLIGKSRDESNHSSYTVDIGVQNRARMQYQMAIHHYLNRNFQAAWDIVYPIVQDTHNLDKLLTVKFFKVYLSLVDMILKGVFNTSSQNLKQVFNDGLIYKQVVDIYDGKLAICDPELFLMCCVIELSNGFPLEELERQLESFLDANKVTNSSWSETEVALKDEKIENVFKFYLQVEVKLEKADRAQDVISRVFVMSEVKMNEYMKVLSSIVEEEKKKRTVKTNTKKTIKTIKKHREPVTQVKQPTVKSKSSQVIDKEVEPIKPTIEGQRTETTTLIETVSDYFNRQWMRVQKNPLQSIMKVGSVIVFILTLLIALNKFGHRKRFRRMLIWLMEKIRDTLTMGLKVTYV